MAPLTTIPDHVRFLILGAGPTGIGAARRLTELGETDFRVIEANSFAGGLASSFKDARGFTWDIGGHVQFSHYEAFDRAMIDALGPDGWLTHSRESWIWMRDRFTPYPFQNNLARLPAADQLRAIAGLAAVKLGGLSRPASTPPRHFAEWIRASFGAGIAEQFMLPYNEKVWAYPLDRLDYEWIGERVAHPALGRVLKNALLRRDDSTWGPNATFRFPKSGGTGAVWKSLAAQLPTDRIAYQMRVVSIDRTRRVATLENGQNVTFEHVLSSLPLDQLVRLTHPVSPQSRKRLDAFLYSASNIVGIGLAGQPGEHLRTKSWMYFPEPELPFYRVTVFSNYSPHNVAEPGRQWSLMAEVAESPHRLLPSQDLVHDVVEGLKRARLISERDHIVSRWSFRAPYGYPTPFLGRNAHLQALHAELEESQIFSRGRFGAWKYEVSNQDHTYMQGVEWADRMVRGTPELTINYPARVNAGYQKKI